MLCLVDAKMKSRYYAMFRLIKTYKCIFLKYSNILFQKLVRGVNLNSIKTILISLT